MEKKFTVAVRFKHQSAGDGKLWKGLQDHSSNYYRVRVIWKKSNEAMKEASLVKLCLPEPPTPTSKALPPGVRIILDTYSDNRKRKH